METTKIKISREKINLFKVLLLGSLLSLIGLNSVNAAYYNLGTLDVKPVSGEWFVETLQPGQAKQQQMQISNFSGEEMDLVIYVADAGANGEGEFFAKSIEQTSEDLVNWVNLPVKHLSLGPAESKILSVNFQLPENAGIGLHTGAIIVRETREKNLGEKTSRFFMEKGIRIYLTVSGTPIENSKVSAPELKTAADESEFTFIVKNTGNTDIKTDYSLNYRPLFDAETAIAAEKPAKENIFAAPSLGKVLIKPGQEKRLALSTANPGFGLYQLYLNNGKDSALLGTTLFIPFWMPLLASLLLAAFVIIKKQGGEKNPAEKAGK